MNKKLLALTLSGALAVSMLAGCGGSSNGGDTSTSTDTKADTTEASGAEGIKGTKTRLRFCQRPV